VAAEPAAAHLHCSLQLPAKAGLQQDEHAASDMMAAAQEVDRFPLPWPRRDVPQALLAVQLQVIIDQMLGFLSWQE